MINNDLRVTGALASSLPCHTISCLDKHNFLSGERVSLFVFLWNCREKMMLAHFGLRNNAAF